MSKPINQKPTVQNDSKESAVPKFGRVLVETNQSAPSPTFMSPKKFDKNNKADLKVMKLLQSLKPTSNILDFRFDY